VVWGIKDAIDERCMKTESQGEWKNKKTDSYTEDWGSSYNRCNFYGEGNGTPVCTKSDGSGWSSSGAVDQSACGFLIVKLPVDAAGHNFWRATRGYQR